jgi:hypothetical protein
LLPIEIITDCEIVSFSKGSLLDHGIIAQANSRTERMDSIAAFTWSAGMSKTPRLFEIPSWQCIISYVVSAFVSIL